MECRRVEKVPGLRSLKPLPRYRSGPAFRRSQPPGLRRGHRHFAGEEIASRRFRTRCSFPSSLDALNDRVPTPEVLLQSN